MPMIPTLHKSFLGAASVSACFTALESATSFPLLKLEEQDLMVGFVRVGMHRPPPPQQFGRIKSYAFPSVKIYRRFI